MGNTKQPNSIVFHPSFFETISTLGGEGLGWDLFVAICRYGMYGEDDKYDNITIKALMQQIKPVIDASTSRWKRTSEVRSEAGKLGGAPKGNHNAVKNWDIISKQPKEQQEEAKNSDGTFYGSEINEENVEKKNTVKNYEIVSKQAKTSKNKQNKLDIDIDIDIEKDIDIDKEIDIEKEKDKYIENKENIIKEKNKNNKTKNNNELIGNMVGLQEKTNSLIDSKVGLQEKNEANINEFDIKKKEEKDSAEKEERNAGAEQPAAPSLEEAIDYVINVVKNAVERKGGVYNPNNERKFAKEILTSEEIKQRRLEHYKPTLKEFLEATVYNSYVSYNQYIKVDSLFRLFYSYQDIYNNAVTNEGRKTAIEFYFFHLPSSERQKKHNAIAKFISEKVPLPW